MKQKCLQLWHARNSRFFWFHRTSLARVLLKVLRLTVTKKNCEKKNIILLPKLGIISTQYKHTCASSLALEVLSSYHWQFSWYQTYFHPIPTREHEVKVRIMEQVILVDVPEVCYLPSHLRNHTSQHLQNIYTSDNSQECLNNGIKQLIQELEAY